eukprot:13634378-Alexandrium_andersonii.AAC.1
MEAAAVGPEEQAEARLVRVGGLEVVVDRLTQHVGQEAAVVRCRIHAGRLGGDGRAADPLDA